MKNFDNNNESCFLLVVKFIAGYMSELSIVRVPHMTNKANPGFSTSIKHTLRNRERTALFSSGGGGGGRAGE